MPNSSAEMKAQQAKWEAQGLCKKCGSAIDKPHYVKCKYCRDQNARHVIASRERRGLAPKKSKCSLCDEIGHTYPRCPLNPDNT